MIARTVSGETLVNPLSTMVSLLRETRQTAHIEVSVNDA
jgi:hypothetical protein